MMELFVAPKPNKQFLSFGEMVIELDAEFVYVC